MRQLGWGLGLIVLGVFQKVVVADGLLSPAAEEVFGADAHVSFLDAWLGTLAFSGQIFCDFAGYSTTAIGVALTLGFSLPNNFRFPYAAIGFSDFWRRWHISLSTWLRDYLYIPLGGNRKGPGRTYVNLMLTMLLGGLWHGASWTFVVWGGLHGLYLAVERLLTARFAGAAIAQTWLFRVWLALLTYFFVNLTWVFFRAPDFATAWRMITSMFGLAPQDAGTPLPTLWIVQVVVTTVAMVAIHWRMRDTSIEAVVQKIPAPLLGVTLGAMLFLIIITQGSGNAFIYFQF
jgi:alginate O-acetyltransferase complex protein AlgI